MVDKLGTIIDKDKEYFLGHTFSFAARSLSKNNAVVIDMAKGFNLRDVKDVDVNELLSKVIKERNLKIEPVSVINDTTATLLTGNYANRNADIAMIIGTGHNACFKSNSGEIINIESAYMSKGIPLSYFDFSLLDKLKDSKDTILEVLIGGKYLGLIAQEITDELFESGFLKNKLKLSSKKLTEAVEKHLSDDFSQEEKEVVEEIAIIILKRVAKLIVCEINAILRYIDEDLENKHCVVFDGTVYEKNKLLQEYIIMYLEKIYGDNAKKIETLLIKDASSIGAVISIFPLI
jgi:hexokinase